MARGTGGFGYAECKLCGKRLPFTYSTLIKNDAEIIEARLIDRHLADEHEGEK